MQRTATLFSDVYPGVLPTGVEAAMIGLAPASAIAPMESGGLSLHSRGLLYRLADALFPHRCGGSCAMNAALHFSKEPGGRPFGLFADGIHLSAGISHSHGALVAVLSETHEVGIDLEPVHRSVHPRLMQRMAHPRESAGELEPIRLWTIKEAVLKLTGSGLRVPMNSLHVVPVTADLFDVSDTNRTFRVVSFQYETFWLSVAWHHR